MRPPDTNQQLKEAYRQLKEAYQQPKETARALRVHSDFDRTHMKFLDAALAVAEYLRRAEEADYYAQLEPEDHIWHQVKTIFEFFETVDRLPAPSAHAL